MSACAGEWVEVASKEEILATLDKDGRLDGMPFMPEMFAYCGKRFRVHKRAHKACDTINPVSQRALPRSVILEDVRCTGAAHGGCQAACALFWKDAWLKPAGELAPAAAPAPPPAIGGCTEQDVLNGAVAGKSKSGKLRYSCQATDFPAYTTHLSARLPSQYIEDVRSGNVTPDAFIGQAAYFGYDLLARPQSPNGELFRGLYDRFVALWGGVPYPRRRGQLEDAGEAPVEALDLKPGELVRVKPYKDILATLDKRNMNRGLYFDAEMVPYCGGVFRVRARVDHFVDERTGYMRTMRTPAVILENVWCRSHFSERRIFCPRAIYSWWRESWLERAPEAKEPSVAEALGARAILKSWPQERAG